MDYTALKTELQTDPSSLGYSSALASGGDATLANLLNQVRATIDIDRGTVSSYEVFEAIVPSEWTALAAAEKQRVETIMSMGTVNLKGTNTRASLAAAFGAGTTSRTNLLALQARKGSRAEQLFGSGVTVSHEDIAQARRA